MVCVYVAAVVCVITTICDVDHDTAHRSTQLLSTTYSRNRLSRVIGQPAVVLSWRQLVPPSKSYFLVT